MCTHLYDQIAQLSTPERRDLETLITHRYAVEPHRWDRWIRRGIKIASVLAPVGAAFALLTAPIPPVGSDLWIADGLGLAVLALSGLWGVLSC